MCIFSTESVRDIASKLGVHQQECIAFAFHELFEEVETLAVGDSNDGSDGSVKP